LFYGRSSGLRHFNLAASPPPNQPPAASRRLGLSRNWTPALSSMASSSLVLSISRRSPTGARSAAKSKRHVALLSPTKGEHRRAAITCHAETNPPRPTRLRRPNRRLRHNQERSHLPHPSRQMCDPRRPLFLIIGADVVTALPRAIRARKGERLRGKGYSYREGDTRKQHLHDYLPHFPVGA
jgi:hypothetical protein